MLLERAAKLDAARVGQALVDERDLGRELRLQVARRRGRGRALGPDARRGEDLDRRLAHRVVVVDDEHRPRGDAAAGGRQVEGAGHAVAAAVAEATRPSSCGTGKGLLRTAKAFARCASRIWAWLA